MIALLNNSNNIQNVTHCCHNDGRPCDCYSCLRSGFYEGTDTYTCLKKLCHYVMNYGPIYVSEIYHFLACSQLLEKNFTNNVRILSLGCGFGPDFIALQKYIQNNNFTLNVNYVGYDQEQNWTAITNGVFNNLPNISNLLSGFTLNNFDIIFLNKFFSTLLRNGAGQIFLNQFINEIQNSMPLGSYIIYNDINNIKNGRDLFDNSMQQVVRIVGKYFFRNDTPYGNNYTEIQHINNICQIPHNLPVQPKRSVTKSIFFVYQKI